jgi:ABC-type cobalt transport system substrate-binding protein
MAPPTPRILLLGGHGKVSLLMTPKILSRSWNLTSMIRNPDQKSDILEAGKNGPGKLDVLVKSIEDVKSDDDAKKILDKVKPDWVIWSAGMFTPPLYCLLFIMRLAWGYELIFYMMMQEQEEKAAPPAPTPSTETPVSISSAPRLQLPPSRNSSSFPRSPSVANEQAGSMTTPTL